MHFFCIVHRLLVVLEETICSTVVSLAHELERRFLLTAPARSSCRPALLPPSDRGDVLGASCLKGLLLCPLTLLSTDLIPTLRMIQRSITPEDRGLHFPVLLSHNSKKALRTWTYVSKASQGWARCGGDAARSALLLWHSQEELQTSWIAGAPVYLHIPACFRGQGPASLRPKPVNLPSRWITAWFCIVNSRLETLTNQLPAADYRH